MRKCDCDFNYLVYLALRNRTRSGDEKVEKKIDLRKKKSFRQKAAIKTFLLECNDFGRFAVDDIFPSTHGSVIERLSKERGRR